MKNIFSSNQKGLVFLLNGLRKISYPYFGMIIENSSGEYISSKLVQNLNEELNELQ